MYYQPYTCLTAFGAGHGIFPYFLMAVLQLHSASKRFGEKQILDRVKFNLKTGEVLGLFGRNGSGKSTLLRILFGTLRADALNLQMDGKTLPRGEIIKRRQIAYLPQVSFLPQHATVRRIIPRFFPAGDDQDRIFYDPGITRIDDRKISQLSQGERRYLELLLLGNLDHPFILLDEPFSMVEPLYAERIRIFIEALSKKKGIILTDHYYENVWNVSSKNIVLSNAVLHPITQKDELREMGYLKNDQ